MTARTLLPVLAAVLLSAAPAAAAATKPTATTRGAARMTQTSATLTGSVNPNGARTTYWFQYGPSKHYGAATGPADAGSGTHARAAAADLTGLAPFTRYHYRLVARNRTARASAATGRSRRVSSRWASAWPATRTRPSGEPARRSPAS